VNKHITKSTFISTEQNKYIKKFTISHNMQQMLNCTVPSLQQHGS